MPTPVKKKLESKGTSGHAAHNATDVPERPFQRNALKKVSSKELDREIRNRAKDWHVLTRKAQTLEKERLLPVIEEVGRRIKKGQTVAGYRGIEAYINSLGLPPSLVRKWRFRERKKNGKKSAAGLMQNADALTHGGYYRKDITRGSTRHSGAAMKTPRCSAPVNLI